MKVDPTDDCVLVGKDGKSVKQLMLASLTLGLLRAIFSWKN